LSCKIKAMENYYLDKPIKTFCIEANNFPMGIKAAYEKLHALLPTTEGRKFYGLSWGAGQGKIIYKAAVKELYEGEAEKYGCETFIIRQGNYISEVLKDWMKEENIVAKTFMQLLSAPGILQDGYCVEEYLDEKDMRCLVTLA